MQVYLIIKSWLNLEKNSQQILAAFLKSDFQQWNPELFKI